MPTAFMWNESWVGHPGVTQIRTKIWHAVLYLEPEVEVVVEEFDSRGAVVGDAAGITGRSTDGEIDYRGTYQVPREGYFEKLNKLTGRKS